MQGVDFEGKPSIEGRWRVCVAPMLDWTDENKKGLSDQMLRPFCL